MQNFLEEVVEEICQKHTHIEDIVFILPSKRAGTFLRNCIAKTTKKTFFSPEIYSIESFVEKISGLTYASNTLQLFELYDTYLKTFRGEKDNFYTFSKWGRTLLQDFNEIDRYLVDSNNIFSNLASIREMEHWSPEATKTQMMKDYIHFWNNLGNLYTSFNQALQNRGVGHQGLVYRQAQKKLKAYLESNQNTTHIFIGFNALNTAESHIIQDILATSKSDIYWDIDTYFIKDPIHDAGYFIRQHQSSWDYFKKHALKGIQDNYLSKKNIQIIGVPKNISQTKYVGNLLGELIVQKPETLKNTAVVLGDETLLNPLLNSIPKEVEGVNITMGYPLYKSPVAALFLEFLTLYGKKEDRGWFYQDILTFLSHPYIQILLTDGSKDIAATVSEKIKNKNWAYINIEGLKSLTKEHPDSLNQLFFKEYLSPAQFIEKCLELLLSLKVKFQESKNALGLEYLYRFYTLFNELKQLVEEHSFVNDLKSLQSLYQELLSSETLDFKGEPLKGLQIMGMLESRNLDFETVILTSVNEGILPSGKSNNSFIPFDIKLAYKLPTYKEKDAVYTYHFYRLLQRAKNIYIIYNTEPDVLEGGEKSRLINQLLTDENKLGDITQIIAAPKIKPTVKTWETIDKDTHLIQSIKNLAGNGFSPTSLTNYIRNPIDFYKKNILRIDDIPEVEETVAANTFGTIIHDTLEELYQPLVGNYLTSEKLKSLKINLRSIVKKHFVKSYSDGDISRGKNLIAFEVVIGYLENFINLEIEDAKKHQIKILGLEESLKIELDIPELHFPVVLKGKLDRIDEKDGVKRIIDYKTGTVRPPQVKVTDWQEIITDYDKSKAFQLLCYALLHDYKEPITSVKAGIISFKNLNKGLFEFTNNNHGFVDPSTLSDFKEILKGLILEICDPGTPFKEKEV
ncbi:MAG: PD-(D/E)XK nuclease family protein [Saonia sp.]